MALLERYSLLLKEPKLKKSTLKKLHDVRGEDCWIRLPGGSCDGDTVVYAHYRTARAGFGTGKKGVWGAPACHRCHDIIDGRVKGFERDFVRLAHAEAVIRYWEKLRCNLFVTLP